MKSSVLILIVLFIALVVLVVGGLGIWYSDSGTIVPAVEEIAASPPPATEPPKRTVVKTPVFQPPTPGQQSASAKPTNATTTPAAEPAPAEPPEEAPNMDARLQDVLTSGKGDREIATDLLGLLPQMPPERQGEVAQLMAGLMPDDGYAALVPLVTNPALGEQVVDALMVDLLDRPDTIQLPLFLDIARNPAHPRQQEALDYLGLHLDADHGTDWGAWQGAIETYLRNPPQEL